MPHLLEFSYLHHGLLASLSGIAVLQYVFPTYRSTPLWPSACMFGIEGGDGYSRRIASADESVRKRMRPPVGSSARCHTLSGYILETFRKTKQLPVVLRVPGKPVHFEPLVGKINPMRRCLQTG